MDVFVEMRGRDFDVGEAKKCNPLGELMESWHKGESLGLKRKREFSDSGFSIYVGGEDDSELAQESLDTVAFLRENAGEIRQLRALPGIDSAYIRFGTVWPSDSLMRVSSFPSDLLLACGELGLGIDLCWYLGEPEFETDDETI